MSEMPRYHVEIYFDGDLIDDFEVEAEDKDTAMEYGYESARELIKVYGITVTLKVAGELREIEYYFPESQIIEDVIEEYVTVIVIEDPADGPE